MYIPQRMCVACRNMKPKDELIRFAKSGGAVMVDTSKKTGGRGAYICKSEECINSAKKRCALSKHFKTAVPDEIYDAAREMIKGE